MATELVWYSDCNVAFPDVSTAALAAKSSLWLEQSLLLGGSTGSHGPNGAPPVGSRWICAGSSDSVTAGMDGVNRWGASVFDGTKIVRANGAVAHSWMVLQSPAAKGPYYLIIDYNTAADTNIVIVGSKTLPTGGSITARPTATDEWVHTTFIFNDGTATNQMAHRATTANGDYYFLTSKVGVSPNRFQYCQAFPELAETKTGDNYKSFTICTYNNSTTGETIGVLNGNVGSSFTAFDVTNIIKTRNGGGTVVVDCSTPMTMFNAGQATIWVSSGIASSNPLSATWDAFPVWLFVGTSGQRQIKGRVPDLLQSSNQIPQGSTTPATGNVERIFTGTCWTPLDVAPSF